MKVRRTSSHVVTVCVASLALLLVVGCATSGNQSHVKGDNNLNVFMATGPASADKHIGTVAAEVDPTANISDNAANTGDNAKTTSQGKTIVKPSKTDGAGTAGEQPGNAEVLKVLEMIRDLMKDYLQLQKATPADDAAEPEDKGTEGAEPTEEGEGAK